MTRVLTNQLSAPPLSSLTVDVFSNVVPAPLYVQVWFIWNPMEIHLHFLRPGLNHRTPLGSNLKGGEGGGESSIKHGHDITVIHSSFSVHIHSMVPVSPLLKVWVCDRGLELQ